MNKLAAFDMDGTLVEGRFVFALSGSLGLDGKVREIQADARLSNFEKTRDIARLFAGVARKDFESAIESIPLAKNCERALAALRKHGFAMGIISDSYTVAAGYLAARLDMGFVAANDLQFENGVATGRVVMPLGWEKIGCFCKLSVCKRFHLETHAHRLGIAIANTAAIGDSRGDVCMVRCAGAGIAFMPKDAEIEAATGQIVREPDMMQVARLLLGAAP
ncbi:MAG: HAD-IB family phosphatase [Nitrososphaera sp.]|jgi:phosphoserine phosphatase